MGEPIVLVFENTELAVKGFSEHFIKLLNSKKGIFNVVLSGGNTPRDWFEDLVINHSKEIDWSRVHFYWGDERCVPPDDPDSNYGMTKKYLFDRLDVPAKNIHRIYGELIPEEAAKSYINELWLNFGEEIPVFDLIILGMGEDGHTASIFPHQISLWEEDAYCVVATHPVSGQHRVSLTGKVINNAKSVAFIVTGKNKAEKIREILHEDPVSSNYPARLVDPIRNDLYWFLDKTAADFLTYD